MHKELTGCMTERSLSLSFDRIRGAFELRPATEQQLLELLDEWMGIARGWWIYACALGWAILHRGPRGKGLTPMLARKPSRSRVANGFHNRLQGRV
jgi:hypothetical protein